MTTLNYLSNKELLNEIHKSKLTFCSLVHPEYQDKKYKEYDIIVQDLDNVTDELINDAKAAKAQKIFKKKKEELLELNFKPSEINIEVLPDSISTEDLVFRLMTNEHIPISELKTKKKKKAAVVDDDLAEEDEDKTKVNFPPFKHYVLKDGKFIEVLRSHWHNGEFNTENGKITNKLAMMFIKIVERYAQRGNWRGYSYLDEMKGQALLQLSQMGLQFDESRSNNPFAYFTTALTNSFTRILNIEKKNQNIRDDILQAYGHNPSFTRQIEHEKKSSESKE